MSKCSVHGGRDLAACDHKSYEREAKKEERKERKRVKREAQIVAKLEVGAFANGK